MAWFERRQRGLNPQKRKEIPKGLWIKCDKCDAMLYKAELERDANVCSKCDYHFKIGYEQYISLVMDPDTFIEEDTDLRTVDPLQFKEKENYPEYLKKYQKKTGMQEAVVSGTGRIAERLVSLSIHDGSFLAGSMGSVVGEKVTRSIRRSIDLQIPFLVIATSGGARMQEGILSLMQMAKTSLWLNRLSKEKLPFIVLITNPTMAGVMASYASLGDFTLAEPGAMMGFAGGRVIEQTIGSSLPEGFQTSEFFLTKGFVDQVVPRAHIRDTLKKILSLFPDREVNN
tara:strand:+ start:4411 stop:5265 length:855 start_codon:yes stop_codon:yes gene_type:complete